VDLARHHDGLSLVRLYDRAELAVVGSTCKHAVRGLDIAKGNINQRDWTDGCLRRGDVFFCLLTED
jgi:hypothetical protein